MAPVYVPTVLHPLEHQRYSHGAITAEEARVRLERSPGSFLVRTAHEGRCWHILAPGVKIVARANNSGPGVSISGDGRVFANVPRLVRVLCDAGILTKVCHRVSPAR